MNYRMVPGPRPYLEVLRKEVPIASATDALELVVLCGENDTQIGTDNFRRMAYEANQGSHFRVFTDEVSAASWLVSG